MLPKLIVVPLSESPACTPVPESVTFEVESSIDVLWIVSVAVLSPVAVG